MINTLPAIRSLTTFAEIFPQGTVMFPRTTVEKMRWVGFSQYRLDGITGTPVSTLGDMPLICHCNTLIPEIREFFNLAGVRLDGRYLVYESEAEAIALAEECYEHGQRITYYYPPHDEIAGDQNLVVTESMYNWLNDKANIDNLCSMKHLPHHRYFLPDELVGILDFLPGQPIYAKICHPGVSGGGADVYYSPNQSSRGELMDWMLTRPAGWSSIRVEEHISVLESWCLNFSIRPDGVSYLGAAIQLFEKPAMQCGSLIDPLLQPSETTIAIATEVAERAGKMGYIGFAGFDVGEDVNGRACVFDLNFRPAACTSQVLIHASATERIGCSMSLSWRKMFQGSIVPVMKALEKFVCSGQFVPLSLYETTKVPGDLSRIQGMLIAHNRDEIYELESMVNLSCAQFEA